MVKLCVYSSWKRFKKVRVSFFMFWGIILVQSSFHVKHKIELSYLLFAAYHLLTRCSACL